MTSTGIEVLTIFPYHNFNIPCKAGLWSWMEKLYEGRASQELQQKRIEVGGTFDHHFVAGAGDDR